MEDTEFCHLKWGSHNIERKKAKLKKLGLACVPGSLWQQQDYPNETGFWRDEVPYFFYTYFPGKWKDSIKQHVCAVLKV